jgi:hypothetical protein
MLTDPVPRQKTLKDEYSRSDKLRTIALPEPEPARTYARKLALALADENRAGVQAAANAIAEAVALTFQITGSPVKVLGVRPRQVTETSVYETFGDYDTETMRIRLWMRTAVLQKPSAFGTLLSTLSHELCHHLDVVALDLPNTYHTRGFYERAGLLYHHLKDTPIRALVWTELAGGRYSINWPATMRGSKKDA